MNAIVLISGIACLLSAVFCLQIVSINYRNKSHILRMFQLGLFAFFLLTGVVQIMKVISYNMAGDIPSEYNNYFSLIFIFVCVLVILYFRHYKAKKKVHSH